MSQPTLAPEFQAMCEALAQFPPIPTLTVAAARDMWAAFAAGEREAIGDTIDLQIDGADGKLDARLYRPDGECRGIILFLHGGGWVLGDLASHDVGISALVRRSGCAVLSFQYRLAPETPFPGGLEDCYAALRWLDDHRTELNLLGIPMLVSGDSAGGNLAAALAILARDRGGPAIDGQILLYPVTDGRRSHPSYTERGTGGLLSAADMEWFWNHYAPGNTALDPLASPLLHPDLTGLPPTVLVTAEFDPLRDEGSEYAARLRDAGVACKVLHFDDLPHGFLTSYMLAPSADLAVTAVSDAISELAAEVAQGAPAD